MAKEDDEFLDSAIDIPHDHDVLSGRGNFVNYHPGNEHFRLLVRNNKVAYVACPKPQKGHFSRLIYDEIKKRNPPGRFLKQNPTTKRWYDIGEKKALDKTRQALREGAPEIQKELTTDETSGEFMATSTDITSGNEVKNGQLSMPQHLYQPASMNCLQPGLVQMPFPSGLENPTFRSQTPGQPSFHHVTNQSQQQCNISAGEQYGYYQPQTVQVAYQHRFPAQGPSSIQQSHHQRTETQYPSPHVQPLNQRNLLNNASSSDCYQKPAASNNTIFMFTGERQRADRTGRADAPPRVVSRCHSEECDPVAPLPSETNQDIFFTSGRFRKDGCDPYSNSTSSLGVDGVFHQERSSRSKQNNCSQNSFMSMTEDGLQSDPNLLSGFFNSSLKIGSQKLDQGNSSRFEKTNAMEMSLNAIGEFGETSLAIMKMTDSQANMSFGNVFDESANCGGN